MKPLILVGGGGHCKSVIDVIGDQREILGILDKPEYVGKTILGVPIVGSDNDIPTYVDKAEYMITVGFIKDSGLRVRLYDKVLNAGGEFSTIVATTAHISKYAEMGGVIFS